MNNLVIAYTLDETSLYKFQTLFTNSLASGILVRFISGKRNFARQWELRKSYLLDPENNNIAAPVGLSWHNYGMAVDLIPVDEAGNDNQNYTLLSQIGKIANKIGLTWGGDFKDYNHFEDSAGKNIYDFRKSQYGWQQYQALEDNLKAGTQVIEKKKELIMQA